MKHFDEWELSADFCPIVNVHHGHMSNCCNICYQLSRFSNLIEPLLDSSPADMHDFLRGHFAKKLHMLKVLRPLAKAARDTSLEDLAALCELVTAPISKV